MESTSKPREQIIRWCREHLGQGQVPLFSLTVIVIAASIYFVPQTVTYWRIRPMLLRSPDVPPRGWSSTPKPLTDTAASPDKGTVVSYYGYKFEVPWTDREKDRNGGKWVEISFKNGQTVRFVNPAFFQYNPISDAPALMDHGCFTEDSGGHMPRPRYEALGEVLAATPSQLSPFLSHREFRRIRTMLEIKGLMFEHDPAVLEIFSFQTKNYRGFEYSNLSHGRGEIDLNMFDQADRWFRISMHGGARPEAKLAQAEVNRVINSFGPEPIGR